jgi:putative redox protein
MIGVDSRGVPLVISSWPERDPKWMGQKPSDLLLIAAASCTMYDVLEILRKQREPVETLEVLCEGTQLEDPPHNFTKIHLVYSIRGDVSAQKFERAIDLSQNKYCSVLATLRPSVEITSEYEYVND